MRVVFLAITIAFWPPLFGLVIGAAAFIKEASSLLSAAVLLTAACVHLFLPYFAGMLPEAEPLPGMTMLKAVVITLAQLTIIGAFAARIFGARTGLRLTVVAIGTIGTSSLVSYAVLAALRFLNS